jgi:hypothetical protein
MTTNIKRAVILMLMAAMALPASGQVDIGDATNCEVRSAGADLNDSNATWTPPDLSGFLL